MTTYLKLEKLYGVRKNSDFDNPRTVNGSEFHFPNSSAVMWHQGEYIGNPLFQDIPGPSPVYIVDNYFRKLPGKYKRTSSTISTITSKLKKQIKDRSFKFEQNKMKLFATNKNKVIIYDISQLDNFYKYSEYTTKSYDILINRLSTVVSSTIDPDKLTERHIFIPIHIPKALPIKSELNRLLNLSGNKLLKEVPADAIMFLELIKMLDKDTMSKSIFNSIKDKENNSVVLLFNINGKFTFCKYSYILGLSKDNDIATPIKSESSNTAINRLLKYVLLISLNKSKTKEELKRSTSTDVKATVSDEELESLIERHNEENAVVVAKVETTRKVKSFKEVVEEVKPMATASEESVDEKVEKGLMTEKVADKVKSRLAELDLTMSKLEIPFEDTVLVKNKVKDMKVVLDKNMLDLTMDTFDKQYLKKTYTKHQSLAIHGVSASGNIVSEHTITPKSDINNSTELHEFKILQANGSETKHKIIVPTVSPTGIFKINGNEYKLRKQMIDRPIKKISQLEVALGSYYNKLFIRKAELNAISRAPAIMRQLKKLDSISMIVVGKSKPFDVKLPAIYSTIGRVMKGFRLKGYFLSFDYNSRASRFDISDEKKYGTIIGSRGKTSLYINMKDELIEVNSNKEKNLGNFLVYLGVDETALPIEHANIYILGKRIPLGLVLCYYLGIDNIISSLKASYRKVPLTGKVEYSDTEYMLRFNDTRVVLDRKDEVATILLGGLAKIKDLSDIDLDMLNSRAGTEDLLFIMGFNNRFVRELDNLKSMWVDPITKDVLIKLNEPSTFVGLLYKSAELLVDEYAKDSTDVDGLLLKGYERVNGMIYHILASSVKEYEQKLGQVKGKININPYELLAMLAEDSTFVQADDLNPITIMKQREEITITGKFGRSKETVSDKDRVYNPSAIGVSSEAGKESKDIGMTWYSSASPMIDNTYGILKHNDLKDMTEANVYSSSAALAPLSTSDDGKRGMFISIQNGHVIPTNSQKVVSLRTGFEAVMPYRVGDKYCRFATEDGKVTKLTSSSIEVTYKAGKVKYSLKSWNTKAVGGITYKHDMKTNLMLGDKVGYHDVIVYDSAFFGLDIFDRKRVVYKAGDMVNVMLDESQETYEDSLAISKKLSDIFTTNLSKERSVVVTATSDITDLKRIGSNVKYNDAMFSFLDSSIDSGIDTGLSENSMAILADLKNNSPKSKFNGKFYKLSVRYNCELEDMTESLREIVIKSDKELKETTGFTGKVDKTYSIKGNPLKEGEVEIICYIETVLAMSLGDKLILANQLKGTIGAVYEKIVDEFGVEVDLKTSGAAISARIVSSPETMGSTLAILDKTDKDIVAMYFK